MEMRQLEYFRAVAEELHFTRAAEKLRMSQPSLSQQIRALEEEIGMALFDRIGKKIALTEAGRIFLSHTLNIFHELEQAKSAIGELQGLQRGRLAIGSILSVASFLLPPCLVAFHQQYPNIEISVQEMRADMIKNGLIENRFDFGILFTDLIAPELDSIPLIPVEFALAVSCRHELASQSSVDVEIIEQIPLILLPEPYALRQLITQILGENHCSLQPIMEMTSLDAIIRMVLSGVGGTILPRLYLEQLHNDHLSTIPFSGRINRKDIAIYYRKDKFMCTATRVFIEKLTATAQQFNG